MKNLKEDRYLKWLSFLQYKGISHSNLNDLIFLNKSNFSFFNNEIVDSFKAPIIQNKNNSKFEISSKFLHIYKIPKFVSNNDCAKLIEVINKSRLIRTGKGLKFNDYTDKKCNIDNHEIITRLYESNQQLTGFYSLFRERNYKKHIGEYIKIELKENDASSIELINFNDMLSLSDVF